MQEAVILYSMDIYNIKEDTQEVQEEMQEAVIFYSKEFDDYWHNEMLVKDLAKLVSQLLAKHIKVTIKEG